MTDAQMDAGGAERSAWETTQYEEALAHLEMLQERIDTMRRTIPSIVQPMSKPVKDKAQLFAQIKTAAARAVDDVQTLRTNWTSEQTQALLTRSKESFEKDNNLSKAVNVPRYGWSRGTEMG